MQYATMPTPLHDDVTIRRATTRDLTYIVDLHSKNSEQLGFIPKAGMEEHIMLDHVLLALLNGSPAAYVLHGVPRTSTRIFQAAVQYDVRRMYIGLTLVETLAWMLRPMHVESITASVRDSHPAQVFWGAAGFLPAHLSPGGLKRGKQIIRYVLPLATWKPIVLLEAYDPCTQLLAQSVLKTHWQPARSNKTT